MKNNFCYGDKVLIRSNGICNGLCGTVVGVWEVYGYKNCLKVKVRSESPYVHATICVKESNLRKIEGGHDMTKLTGYKQVAVIKQGCGTYHFAIFDDDYKYKAGDSVIVSGNNQVQTINEIITPEEAAERFSKSITAEVICPVDLSMYQGRVEKRKAADKLKKSMDKIIKEMDENSKYDMYAERNPELKEMLETYKKLTSCS